MNEVARLRKAIRDLHGRESVHVGSVDIHETFQDQIVWKGVVHVFMVQGHPKASRVYAWSYETDEGGRRYIAVLGVPPISSAQDAVRASIAAETPVT